MDEPINIIASWTTRDIKIRDNAECRSKCIHTFDSNRADLESRAIALYVCSLCQKTNSSVYECPCRASVYLHRNWYKYYLLCTRFACTDIVYSTLYMQKNDAKMLWCMLGASFGSVVHVGLRCFLIATTCNGNGAHIQSRDTVCESTLRRATHSYCTTRNDL